MKGLKSNTSIPRTIHYNFGTTELYENYMITIMNEGETVTPSHNNELLQLANSHFKGRPFGYISHRVNSYAVDPKTYLETSKIENLAGFAVVSKESVSKNNIEIEKLFLKKPVEVFHVLEDAETWIEALVAQVK